MEQNRVSDLFNISYYLCVIDFIAIFTHNSLLLLAFILFLLSSKDKDNKEAYLPISQSGIRINISASLTVSLFFWEHIRTYWKVSTILFKYYYNCLIFITYFSCHLFFFMLKILQYKNTQKQYLVIILLYQAQASEPEVDLRDHLIVVSEVGL